MSNSPSVNWLELRGSCQESASAMGDALALATVEGASWKKLQDMGRIKTINLIADLNNGLDPMFTQAGSLRKTEDPTQLRDLIEYIWSYAVDEVREAGHNLYDLLKDNGETPPFDRTEMGKNTNKAIRIRRRAWQNLGVCLLSEDKKIRDDARAMCSPWVVGEPNASWSTRELVWRSGVQAIISDNDMPVNVGNGGEEGSSASLLYYVGDSVPQGDTNFVATFGNTKKAQYTVDMAITTMPFNELYSFLLGAKTWTARYLTQVNGAIKRMEDESTPDDCLISYKDTRSKE